MSEDGRGSADERLDRLYREHPEGFVAGRDELARDLRAAGERERADRVGRLRRPTIPAWLINRAAASATAEVEEFAAASDELERAQARALAGDSKGGEAYRAAAARERAATSAVVEAAEAAAHEAGHPATERMLELVAETLRAASADADLRALVRRGRVERQRSAATLGAAVAGEAAGGGAGRSERRRELDRARRELKWLESELEAATGRESRLRTRVQEATEALARERESLAQSKRATADLRRKVKAARRRAGPV